MKSTTEKRKEHYFNLAYDILARQEEFMTDGKFLYHYNGIWQRVDNGDVIRNMRIIIENMFKEQCDIKMTLSSPTMAKKLYDAIRTSPSIPEVKIELKNSPLVAIENGKIILNLRTMQTRPIKPEDHQFWGYDYCYKPDARWADAPEFCEFAEQSIGIDLKKGNQNDPKRKHLLEIIAYLCTNVFGAKKMIVLLGPPSCGKSVFLQFVKKVVGSGNFVPLSLSDLSDKFRLQLLEHAHMIINDEMPCKGLRHLDLVKRTISCEDLIGEKKKGTPFSFVPTVKIIFAANQLPRLSEYDSGNAFAERLTILHFAKTIPRKDWNLDLADLLFEERDVIISAALQEVQGFLANPTAFDEDMDGRSILADYENENDSVHEFISDTSRCIRSQTPSTGEVRVSVKALYHHYVKYCDDNGISAIDLGTFRSQMEQFGFRRHKLRYHGQSVSCYVGIGLADENMFVLPGEGAVK